MVADLSEDLHQQHRDFNQCKYCGVLETAKHFILTCEAYQDLSRKRTEVNVHHQV